MESENLEGRKSPENSGSDQDSEKLQSVEILERRLNNYKNYVEKYEKEGEERMAQFYTWNVKIVEYELEEARAIEHFKGNYRKIAKLMKELDEKDESLSDREYDEIVNKIKKLIAKIDLNLQLKKRELEKKVAFLGKFESLMKYNRPNMWFYNIQKMVKNGEI